MFVAGVLSWVLTIIPLVPTPNVPLDSKTFDTPQQCWAAAAQFMVDHQFTNWQGLKMNPLVRTDCKQQGVAPN